MNNNMIALMASVGTQIKVLPPAKDKIVKTVCAGVLAAAMGAGVSPANAQEQAKSNFGETAVGAAIGGVAGWGVGKIFDASVATRNVLGGVGAVVGGVIANKNAEAKGAPAGAQPQAGFRPLEADRAERLTQLQLDALSKRVAYQSTVRQAQDAKLDRELNPGNADFDAKWKRASVALVQAKQLDDASSRSFVTAFEAARDARFDLSAYAATYGKLKQPFNVNDQSYTKLAETVTKQADVKTAVEADAHVAGNDPARSGMAP